MYKQVSIGVFLLALSGYAGANDTFKDIGEQIDHIVEQVSEQATVISKFAEDPLLNPFDIKVLVDENNVAHLSGKVDTDIQYHRAIAIVSSLDKIEDVDASDLSVKKSDSLLDDVSLTAKIQGKMLKGKYVDGLDVSFWPMKIETKDGNVYISGEVNSQQDADNILSIVESVKGVRGVKSDLKVSPLQEE